MGVKCGAGTIKPSGAAEFTPGIWGLMGFVFLDHGKANFSKSLGASIPHLSCIRTHNVSGDRN